MPTEALLAATRYAPAWFGIVIVVGFLVLVITTAVIAIRHHE